MSNKQKNWSNLSWCLSQPASKNLSLNYLTRLWLIMKELKQPTKHNFTTSPSPPFTKRKFKLNSRKVITKVNKWEKLFKNHPFDCLKAWRPPLYWYHSDLWATESLVAWLGPEPWTSLPWSSNWQPSNSMVILYLTEPISPIPSSFCSFLSFSTFNHNKFCF